MRWLCYVTFNYQICPMCYKTVNMHAFYRKIFDFSYYLCLVFKSGIFFRRMLVVSQYGIQGLLFENQILEKRSHCQDVCDVQTIIPTTYFPFILRTSTPPIKKDVFGG